MQAVGSKSSKKALPTTAATAAVRVQQHHHQQHFQSTANVDGMNKFHSVIRKLVVWVKNKEN